MSVNARREQRRYTKDYKVEAIKLALQLKDNKRAAIELNLPESTLSTWVKKAERGDIDNTNSSDSDDTGYRDTDVES